MEIILKTTVLKCPDPESEGREGALSMVVATIGAVDKHGDVFVEGSVGRQDVLISQFQHSIWSGGLPIGKGVMYESGNQILCEAQLNMELEIARNTYSAIKFAQELIEVSTGFKLLKYSFGQQDGQTVCYLEQVKAHEASPVIVGAGVGTGVVAMKSAELQAYEQEQRKALPTARFINASEELRRLLEDNHG